MKLLLTGAAGIVGRAIRPHLLERGYSLKITDLQEIDEVFEREEFLQGDIEDASFLEAAMNDVDAVIHLAGLVGPDFTFEQVMGANVNGTYQVFEAGLKCRIKKFVYASSHHAVGFMPRGAKIDHNTPPRSDSYYGMSKAFGETIASYYSDRNGLDVLSIRIGFVGDEVIDERRLHTWCSPRDLTSLIALGLDEKFSGYRVVYGVSDVPDPFFDNQSAEELGYRPQDSSLNHLADPALADARPDPQNPDDWFVGGFFAASGFEGDIEHLRKEHGAEGGIK